MTDLDPRQILPHRDPFAFITTIVTLSYTAPLWLRRWEHIKTTYGHHAMAAATASGRAHSITHLRPRTGPAGTRTG